MSNKLEHFNLFYENLWYSLLFSYVYLLLYCNTQEILKITNWIIWMSIKFDIKYQAGKVWVTETQIYTSRKDRSTKGSSIINFMPKGGKGGLPKHDIRYQLIRGGAVAQKMTINCHSENLHWQIILIQINTTVSRVIIGLISVFPQLLTHPI